MGPPEPHCTVCGAEARGIFCVLAGAHLQRLERERTVRRYERGEALFYAGNPPLAVFCIYSGRVKLYRIGNRADEQVVRLVGPGELLGYRALLANEPYYCTAEAIERTVICMISNQTLLSLLRESPDLALRLMAKMANQLRISEELMVSRTSDPVRVRAARLLLWLIGDTDHKGPTSLQVGVPLRRAEMAQMIGTTPETLSRTLRAFADREYLRLTRADIEVTDLSALRKVARRD